MEPNVWTQLFAQVASFLSNLFASSSNQKNQNSGGVSPNAQESVVASILISKPTTDSILTVMRDPEKETATALFGSMSFNGEFICYTMENKTHQILPGTYIAQLDKSPHLGYVCPHLRVPDRDALADGDAGIRLHIANYPTQLEGCVGLGQQIGPNCLNSSEIAFAKMMSIVPQEFTVVVSANH